MENSSWSHCHRHTAHIDPDQEVSCPFCSLDETLVHLFCGCSRLGVLFGLLQQWGLKWGDSFSFSLFIFGPKYSVKNKQKHVLLNFVFSVAKLGMWLSRKNKIQNKEPKEAHGVFRALLATRLRIEFAYHRLTHNLEMFVKKWTVGNVLCEIDDDDDDDGELRFLF